MGLDQPEQVLFVVVVTDATETLLAFCLDSTF
jgi:hypothetical protein